ncbi:MAG: T9SS type A sorting domain-containing protein [Flavobacteriales bacterium]|nr:T9SS type A sorting domain-containing protein [Flavobacteriales bacterium]
MMLRYSLPLACLLSTATFAQDFITLTDGEGSVVNGTTVVHTGLAGDIGDGTVDEVDILATLVSGPEREINMRRYELEVEPYTQNYFCWGLCYGPQDAGAMPSWSSLPQHSLDMEAGVGLSNFHAYHVPQGVEGCSTYRYVWFDVSNSDDSVWVDIQFCSLGVGIEERASAAHITVFPNPSKGADVEFDVELVNTTGAAALVIHNALGERIRSSALRNGQPVARMSTEGLAPGMYFASVDVQGRTLVTQRFVVSGR